MYGLPQAGILAQKLLAKHFLLMILPSNTLAKNMPIISLPYSNKTMKASLLIGRPNSTAASL
jgi:hypothetical protein